MTVLAHMFLLCTRLHAEDLSFLLGMQQKDLRKLCARLREERLIASHMRAEIRDGTTRPVNREYYYIPLHPVIDAIKYKVSKLTATVKAQYTPSEERKEYICTRCGAEWTELDVLSLYTDEGFVCQNCGAILDSTEDVKGTDSVDRTGHEKNSRLMDQLDKMLKLLRQIDSTEIPANDFDTAWDRKVDVIRNDRTHPTRPAIAVPSRKPAEATVRAGGNIKTDAAALEISLSSSEEKSATEQAQQAARKAELEKQNALPVWHTHSTVSTMAGNVSDAATTTNVKAEQADVTVKPEVKEEEATAEERKPNVDTLDDKVAAYYAEMAKEQALQAQEDATTPDDDESDEEFDEEFEDVGGAEPSETAGAAPTAAGVAGHPSSAALREGQPAPSGIKRELDTADTASTSVPQTATENGGPKPDPEPEPAAKKVKTEEESPRVKNEEKESDEDEDEEFEDV